MSVRAQLLFCPYPPVWLSELCEETSCTRAADVSQTVIARIDSEQHEILYLLLMHTLRSTA